jgi:hypothetical protein
MATKFERVIEAFDAPRPLCRVTRPEAVSVRLRYLF